MKKQRLQDHIEEIKDLFLNQLHSLEMIAQKFKVSRSGIKKILNANDVKTSYDATRPKCTCIACGKEFTKTRARKRNQTGWNDYCSRPCYYKSIEGFGFADNGPARRDARLKMAIEILGTLKLPAGAIVHHIDGNQTNNLPRNLILFVSQAAHLRFHRFCPVEPSELIFDGRIDSPEHRKEAQKRVYILLGQRF